MQEEIKATQVICGEAISSCEEDSAEAADSTKLKEKTTVDCRDHCMHCGTHCIYLDTKQEE